MLYDKHDTKWKCAIIGRKYLSYSLKQNSGRNLAFSYGEKTNSEENICRRCNGYLNLQTGGQKPKTFKSETEGPYL